MDDSTNKIHDRAYNRRMSWRKAIRKKNLENDIDFEAKEKPLYNNLHQYSKNKIIHPRGAWENAERKSNSDCYKKISWRKRLERFKDSPDNEE